MHPYIQTLKQYYKTHTTRSRVFLSILGILIFLGISRMLLPYAIIYSSVSWLNDQGITANIEDISIDVFNGSVILKNARGEDDNNHSFVIGDIELFWDWSPLSDKTVQVIKIKLDNIKFDVEQYNDLMVVSGIKIKPSTAIEKTIEDDAKESAPWGTALHTIELSNIALCYQQHDIVYADASDDTRKIDYCLHLDEMTWQGELSRKTNSTSKTETNTQQLYYNSDGDFRLNNFVITDNLLQKTFIDIEKFDLNQVVIKSLYDISLTSVVLSNVSAMQRNDSEHIDAARINELTISDIRFKNLNHLSVDAINIRDPGLFIQKDKLGQWEYQQWIPELVSTAENNSLVDKTTSTVTNPDNSTAMPVSKEASHIEKPAFIAELGSVTIHNSDFCYDDKPSNLYTCFTQELLSWKGHSSFKGASDISLQGELQLQTTTILNQKTKKHILDLELASISKIKVNSLDDIAIAFIKLRKLQGLQRTAKGKTNIASIDKLDISHLKLSNMHRLSIKEIVLDTPDVYLQKDKKGRWEFDSLIPKIKDTATKTSTSKSTAKKPTSKPFLAQLGNIKVLHSDLCYQDNAEKLYYCFIQENTSWKGSITIDPATDTLKAKGSLIASSTRIHNELINRDLLRLKTLSFNQADIKSINDINVGTIKLTKLLALERSKKSNRYTLWLDSIIVENIALNNTDTLKINSLLISEPGLQVSKNKDANWEHDIWLAKKTDKQIEPVKTAPSSSANNTPFNIILNTFKVNTRQKITFTDNSLSPTMKVGMKKIDLIVNDIDSTQPKQKTTFELDAQSDRHATIDIKGYALPFAEKPSFDANGELLGFDMRAASPAAQKAIGHFIKSGQMDAQLTLLAEDGILDSNIALTLNHFNLEAASKEDAEELDATFGMPVNQSLTLLRDKDNSIHLNLPITGDINSPEFDPSHAIIKATTKATTVALITFYTPYGLIYAGGNILFDLATAMDFPSLLFEPGETTLSADNKKQLDSLSTMLTEKPQLHLTFCGTANLKDRLALYPVEQVKTKQTAEGKTIEPPALPKLTKEQRLKLEFIADDRQKNTKQYLIETAKIKHSRLIICAPAYSAEEDAISGVKIEI